MLHILMVDDHPSVMEGTKMMLEKESDFQVSFCFPEDEVVQIVTSNAFDVMLFDLNMPGINGIELTKMVLAAQPKAVILIFTGLDITPYFHQLIELGVAGFISKTATQEHLVSSIRCAIRKEAVIPLTLLRELNKNKYRDKLKAGEDKGGDEAMQMIPREIEIIKEIAKGKTNKMIAEMMLMSQRSLEYALTQVFQKLQVHSRLEAVTKSKRLGIITDGDFL
ncbi:response regulator transcription factor [Paenibacillus agricola]|uniref:Response regulator transcription factor n=1 Tax=Paenibacillus agricola TaxID=2716264 RepID=A0ABX0JDL5_9BACL|nr:response regulator transcription factor [Paenibacillus agricola]NHN32803.1 response regulator transcription factor [Paenibacillus agricola]